MAKGKRDDLRPLVECLLTRVRELEIRVDDLEPDEDELLQVYPPVSPIQASPAAADRQTAILKRATHARVGKQ